MAACFCAISLNCVTLVADRFRGNGEAQSLGGNALRRESHFGRADSDEAAGEIDERAAAVARIDGGVGLQQILVIDFVDGDVAFGPAQDSPADRAAVSGRVTDHEHRLAQEVRGDVVEIDKREIRFGVDFDEGEVLLLVARDVVGVVGLPVVHRHLDLQIGRALHDVLVGHDITRGIDDESRAKALKGLPDFAGPAAIIAEELRREIFKRIAHPAPDDPLRIDVDDSGQNLGHSQHRRLGGGVRLRKKRGR